MITLVTFITNNDKTLDTELPLLDIYSGNFQLENDTVNVKNASLDNSKSHNNNDIIIGKYQKNICWV